jgi:hypothetical protein
VIKVGGKDYVITKQMKMKYTDGGASKWEVLTKEDTYDLQLDRQKASAVRAKYKEFLKYLRSNLKLRMREDGYAMFGYAEFKNEFGLHQANRDPTAVDFEQYKCMDNKALPNKMFEFMSLISKQGEDTLQMYYRATLMLAGRLYIPNRYYIHIIEGRDVMLIPRGIINKAYECMYKWHSDDVFVRVKLAEGKVPTNKYDTWVSNGVVGE